MQAFDRVLFTFLLPIKPRRNCGVIFTVNRFTDQELAAVYRVMRERRDMRHFLPDRVEPEVLQRLLGAAHLAPSVGLMQPWRFVRITDTALRGRIHRLVDAERLATAQVMGQREASFMQLKVEGIEQCGELLVAALMDKREEHIFGRRTLPEMDLASVSCAIQNLWLAARAEGLGMGWVSMFDPLALAKLLAMPTGAKPVAILCLGHVKEFYPAPMLELEGWTKGAPANKTLFHNFWGIHESTP
ncbi:MAG: 5,6-dimethylbenzimidazole synthase [Cycloclasticus sp.]|nr:5,6-dimethylbenzimidazole synthase [Cycloclasticus sp.]